MELYFGGSRAQNPRFRYSVWIKGPSSEAYQWLQEYPGLEYFDRFYINWLSTRADGAREIQFERHEPAVMFKLRWGGE